MGDEIEPKHILYSSNEELMKMKDEKNRKNKNIPTSLTDNSVSNEDNDVLRGGISHTKINQIEPKDVNFCGIKQSNTVINCLVQKFNHLVFIFCRASVVTHSHTAKT